MLNATQLNVMASGISSLYNLTVNVTDAVGGSILSNVPALIREANVQERQTVAGDGHEITPIDAVGYMPYSDSVQAGNRVKVVTVNGTAATTGQAADYSIATRDDIVSLGKFLQLGLTRTG